MLGHITKNDVDEAKKKIAENYRYADGTWYDKKLWFERPLAGDHVRGYAYDDWREVLDHETEDCFGDHDRIDEYEAWERISDGQYLWHGTVEEAYNLLDGFNRWDDYDSKYVELVTIGILENV